MHNPKNAEIRELTKDELVSVAGGNILVDVVNFAAIYIGDMVAKAARVTTLPKAGNGDCGPNHNGVWSLLACRPVSQPGGFFERALETEMHNAETTSERLLVGSEIDAVNGGFLPAQIVIAACAAAIVIGGWDNHPAVPIETQAKALGMSHLLWL
jgi:hypothetical protein